MLRSPPFNVQAVHVGEREREPAMSPTSLLEWVLHTNHEEKQDMLLRLPANLWSLRGSDWGTEGLVRWHLAGLPRPEVDHSDLSALQGWTHMQMPCQSERLQR